MTYQEHYDLSIQKRDAFWKSIGKVHPDVIAHIINPSFMGGPRWPSVRQAFIVIEKGENTILASDGLSDPYDDYDENPKNQSYNGTGLEVYIVANKIFESFNDIVTSWQCAVLRQVAQTAAANPNLISMLNDYRFVSSTVSNVELPERFITENNDIGIILGLDNPIVPAKLELSIEAISLVNIALLLPIELDYIMKSGGEARIEIGEKLMKLPGAITHPLERDAVI
jgi:hypothetical protein